MDAHASTSKLKKKHFSCVLAYSTLVNSCQSSSAPRCLFYLTRARCSIITWFKSRRATFASWGKFSSHDLLRSNLKRAFQCACSDSLAFSYWFEPCYCYSTCCHTVVLKIILLVFLVLLWNKRSFLGPRGDTTPQRPKAEGRSPAARPSDYKKCCKQLILNIYDHCRLDKAAFLPAPLSSRSVTKQGLDILMTSRYRSVSLWCSP